MASEVAGAVGLEVLEVASYVRGYHAYMDVWVPVEGQALIVKREPYNCKDKNAVAVFKDDAIVGHVPHNLSPRLSQFLMRDVNKAFAEVTGETVNRGAGYGLEIPCVYRLYGPQVYIDKMKEIVDNLRAAGHL